MFLILIPGPVCLISPEELLIDFRELLGEHSGENLAHAVYDTLNTYGLKGCVSLRFVLYCTTTLMFTTHRSLPLTWTTPQTMTPWLNT
jgi:hypothetical protein